MLDEVRVQHLDHVGVHYRITDGLTIDCISVHHIEERGQELVHALAVAAQIGIQFDPYEQDVQDECLRAFLVIKGLIR